MKLVIKYLVELGAEISLLGTAPLFNACSMEMI